MDLLIEMGRASFKVDNSQVVVDNHEVGDSLQHLVDINLEEGLQTIQGKVGITIKDMDFATKAVGKVELVGRAYLNHLASVVTVQGKAVS